MRLLYNETCDSVILSNVANICFIYQPVNTLIDYVSIKKPHLHTSTEI